MKDTHNLAGCNKFDKALIRQNLITMLHAILYCLSCAPRIDELVNFYKMSLAQS